MSGWWSGRLKCQRRRISRSVSSPGNFTGQVLAIVRALDTIFTSTSPSECSTLIPEADNWVLNISRNACLKYLCRRKSPFFTVMDYRGMVQFFFLAFFYFLYFWYVYCPLWKEPRSLHQIWLFCFQLSHSK